MAHGKRPYPCMISDFPAAYDGYGAAGDAWQMKSLITLVLDILLIAQKKPPSTKKNLSPYWGMRPPQTTG